MNMDVNTMDAGPELDALIAGRVFGRQVVADPVNYRGMQLDVGGRGGFDVPHFSTDDAAALLVLDEFRSWWLECNALLTPDKYYCQVSNPLVKGHAYAATRPLAICRAALAALEAR